jgi:Tfp pilus assembly protein PilV
MRKNLQKKKRFISGFMVIEVLVAASIISASILATMAVAQKSVYVSRQAFHTSQAAFLLEEGAEAVRIMRDNAWTNISSLTPDTDYYLIFDGTTWNLSLAPSTIDIFTRSIRIASVSRDDSTKDIAEIGTDDPDTKLIIVSVMWPEGGTVITKTLQFYLMNIFS